MPSGIHWSIQQFLDGYPNEGDDSRMSLNLQFYSNQICCQPDNLRITEIYQKYLLFALWLARTFIAILQVVWKTQNARN
jgi:hypothetical protein